MTKLDLLYITNPLARGGTESHLAMVLPQLMQQTNYNIALYTLGEPGELATALEQSGVKMITNGFVASKYICLALSILRLPLVLLMYRPRVVHCYLPRPFIIGSIFSVLTFCPVLLSSRRCLNHYQKRRPLAAKVERFMQKFCKKVTANSQAILKDLAKEGVPQNKLKLIYNGVEENTALSDTDILTQLGVNINDTVLTLVGNLYAYKGHANLITALSLIKPNLDNVKVLCVGRDCGELKKLKQMASHFGLAQKIIWMGERNDVPAILAASHVGLSCSEEEGFANNILEYMVAGLPVIATAVGGNEEAVKHGETGLLVPVNDSALLSQALLTLINNPQLRLRLGRQGKIRFQDNFTMKRCVKAYMSFYDEFLPGKI